MRGEASDGRSNERPAAIPALRLTRLSPASLLRFPRLSIVKHIRVLRDARSEIIRSREGNYSSRRQCARESSKDIKMLRYQNIIVDISVKCLIVEAVNFMTFVEN